MGRKSYEETQGPLQHSAEVLGCQVDMAFDVSIYPDVDGSLVRENGTTAAVQDEHNQGQTAATICWSIPHTLRNCQEAYFPQGEKQTNKPEAKGSEVSSVAGPRLEGVTIAEVWYHSQSLPTCQDLE